LFKPGERADFLGDRGGNVGYDFEDFGLSHTGGDGGCHRLEPLRKEILASVLAFISASILAWQFAPALNMLKNPLWPQLIAAEAPLDCHFGSFRPAGGRVSLV
jgi:hypothetical protein